MHDVVVEGFFANTGVIDGYVGDAPIETDNYPVSEKESTLDPPATGGALTNVEKLVTFQAQRRNKRWLSWRLKGVTCIITLHAYSR